jgi:hypothetical protein
MQIETIIDVRITLTLWTIHTEFLPHLAGKKQTGQWTRSTSDLFKGYCVCMALPQSNLVLLMSDKDKKIKYFRHWVHC